MFQERKVEKSEIVVLSQGVVFGKRFYIRSVPFKAFKF